MLPIQKKLISINYSKGVTIVPKYVVIHNTSNSNKGADAEAHYRYWSTNENAQSSVHFVVDDHSIIQLLELNQKAWHVGDNRGYSDIQNGNSIGIEICENSDGDYKKAEENAKDLVAYLLKTLGLSIESTVTHQMASGKYCPHIILDNRTWGNFIQDVKDRLYGNAPKTNQPVYCIRKSWMDASSQLNAYTNLDYAKEDADNHPGYYVFNENGQVVYPIKPTINYENELCRILVDGKNLIALTGKTKCINWAKDNYTGHIVIQCVSNDVIVGEFDIAKPQPIQIPYKKSVELFQIATNKMGIKDEHGRLLVVDGELGDNTKYVIASSEVVVKRGDKNPLVGVIQTILNVSVDNVYGQAPYHETYDAIGNFQKNNGLVDDYVVGKNTWTKLLDK